MSVTKARGTTQVFSNSGPTKACGFNSQREHTLKHIMILGAKTLNLFVLPVEINFWGYHTGGVEDSGLLGCYSVSLGVSRPFLRHWVTSKRWQLFTQRHTVHLNLPLGTLQVTLANNVLVFLIHNNWVRSETNVDCILRSKYSERLTL